MLTLYHQGGAVCAQKVRLALAEKGLERQGVEPDLMDPATRRGVPEAQSERGGADAGRDGNPIIESNVILEYLDEIGPEPPLHPADAYGRALMRIWLSQIDLDVHVSVNAPELCDQPAAPVPADAARAPRGDVPGDAGRGETLATARPGGEGSDSFLVGIAAKRFQRLFADMERTLAAQEWLAGEGYTLADGLHALRAPDEELDWRPCGRVRTRGCSAGMSAQARPSFAEAILKYPPPAVAGGPPPGAGAPAVWPRIQKLLEAD